MKYAFTRCGFFSKSNACVLIAISAGWVSTSHLHAETIDGGSEVQGNFTVGTTSTKGKLTVKAPNSVATDQAILGLEVSSAGGVYFGTSTNYGTLSYLPSFGSSNGFYYSAALASVQLGENVGYSMGRSSIAIGTYAEAPGDFSISAGAYTYAEGEASAAFNGSSASGYYSFSANWGQASADLSFAAGSTVTATSYSSAVFGAFNKPPTANATAWVSTDPLFTIGNGTAYNQLSNALIVQKNGVANFYAFGAASTNPAIVLNPTGTTPSITIGGQKVVTADSSGSLSIGPRNPTVPTDRKAIEINAGGYGAPAAYNTASNGDKLILFRDGAANYDATIGVGSAADMWFKSSGTGGNGMFKWYTGSSVTNSMVLDGAGRLGIGTTTPQTALTVAADTDAHISLVRNTGSNNWNYIDFYDGATRKWVLGQSNAAGAFTIYNQALGQQVFNVTTAGNVGIGTTTPSVHLKVGAGTGAEAIAINGGTGNGEGAGLGIEQAGVTIGSIGNTARLIGGGTSQAFRMQAQNSNNIEIVTYHSNPILFATGNTERMRVDASGNLGIGTSSPSAKLEVVGTVKFAKQGDIPMGEFGLNGD